MSDNYTVSALKFRPQSFEQIVGQPHIVKTLTNAISNGRIGHAYLFSGTRGVGKTTSARILAKALNCKEGPTATPCQVCSNCKEIAAGSSIDVLEIDGASNRGIDNIREIRENARFTPNNSNYKIYIIDEVHQITKEAFNALLKTLEEPPPHVVFIFATTEQAKVPDTILSRCQAFEYRSISNSDIANQLAMIAKTENITASDGALSLLARRARGSMRDAQSLFDQTAAYGGGEINEEDVKLILGLVDRRLVIETIKSAANGDKASLFHSSEQLSKAGADPTLFAEEISETLRDIMAIKIGASKSDKNNDEETELSAIAEKLPIDEISRWFDVISITIDSMRRSYNPIINLEMGLVKLAEHRKLVKVDDLLDRVARATSHVEGKLGEDKADIARSGTLLTPPEPQPTAPAPPPVVSVAAPVTKPEPVSEDTSDTADFEIVETVVKNAPEDLVKEFKKAKPRLMGVFDRAKLHIIEDAVTVTVSNHYELEEVEGERAKLEEILGRLMGKRMRLVVKMTAPNQNAEVNEKARIIEKENDSLTKGKIVETQIVQDALDIFNGEIVDVKIKKD